ncbi:MAG: leucine-rich repeat protein [Ruminococcus sp.]|nr:leucine-rich repeat protein [Ruminococcus sp.]
MRMRKKLALAMALTVICGGNAPFAAELPEMSLTANAEDAVETVKLGDDITYTLDSNGTVTISGTGDMYDFSYSPLIYGYEIKNVVISDGVLNIGDSIFYGCSSLESITIPDSVTSIGDYAFSNCSELTSITIPEGVTSIGGSAFLGTPWLDAKQKENPLVIINSILIDGRTSIGEVEIPEGVTSIGDYAFNNCSELTSITIPESVTSIGGGAFRNCTGLTSITIPEGVTSIGYSAFDGCTGLTSIIIPESMTSIGNFAFWNCTGLTSITIPESVKSIGDKAFNGCSSLEAITILNPECEIYDDPGTISAGLVNGIMDTFSGVIKGYYGSTANIYAGKYHRRFESLGAAPTNTATESGDLNDDGKIDATDATLVLVNYSLLSTGEKMQLTESQQKAADVNGDGKIDSADATTILQYYSYLSTGGDLVFKEFMKQNG